MKREIEYGWAYTNPNVPSPRCRWCDAPNITLPTNVVVCRNCDPHVWST